MQFTLVVSKHSTVCKKGLDWQIAEKTMSNTLIYACLLHWNSIQTNVVLAPCKIVDEKRGALGTINVI